MNYQPVPYARPPSACIITLYSLQEVRQTPQSRYVQNLNLLNIPLMKTLNKTLSFIKLVALLSAKLTNLAATKTPATLSFDYSLRSISLDQLLHHLQTCSAETISAELVELCLTTTQLQLFFKLIDSQTKRTAAQIGNIQRQWNDKNLHLCLPPEQHAQLDKIITLIADTYNHVLQTVSCLRLLSGIPDSLPDLPPAKPHFNRYALEPSEPGRLHALLIHHQLIPKTTLPETTAYLFYGIGSSASWQPVVWLHTVAELSYFVDMFFGISDQRDKWRTAHLCFCDKKRRPFNYNSLRGKQYNYLSNRNSETLRTIDQIRRSLK